MSKKPKQTKTPSEDWESKQFVAWLEARVADGRVLAFSHIANENKSARARMKAHSLGTRAGVPDYVIVVKGCEAPVWVELKRVSGSKKSPEQVRWVQLLAPYSRFCYGATDAIEFVSQFTNQVR